MTGSLWFHSKDEAKHSNFNNIADNDSVIFFKYKTDLIESTAASNGILENEIIVVLLRYLIKFWWSLKMPLINCRVELKLKWTKHYVLAAGGVDNSNADRNNIVFNINDRKLYVPAVKLSSKDNQKLSIAATSDSKIQKMKSVCKV